LSHAVLALLLVSPPVQAVHTSADAPEMKPLRQRCGAECGKGQAEPVGQAVHAVAAVVTEYDPAAHVVHSAAPPADAVPAGHATGLPAGFAHENPAGHDRQDVAPNQDAYVPAEQAVQGMVPPAADVPGGHATGVREQVELAGQARHGDPGVSL
jgi:hypothetical protein